MINPLTWYDGALCKVAGEIAEKFFPELTGDWRVGALSHQPIAESVRLFEGSWPTGKLDAVPLSGREHYFANVGYDIAPAVEAYGVTATAGAVCMRSERAIVVCVKFDLHGNWIRTAFIHEFSHAITPALPPHGPEWQACMRQKAAQARQSGADRLADLLLEDVARHVVADFPQATDALTYTLVALDQREEYRRQVPITVEGGVSLEAWLAARRSAASRIK